MVFTLLNSGANTNSLKSLKALRAFRALRPLRVISKNEGLQIIVNTLFSSLPALKNVMMVTALILLIFAIMGVNFFKGSFYSCDLSDAYPEDQQEQILKGIKTKVECLANGGRWKNSLANFDNVFESLLTLFQMMTTEGWTSVMFTGMDSKDIDEQPKTNARAYFTLYFIFFMVVGFLFLMNLSVGVIIDNFNKIKEQKEVGGIFVTDSQRNWIEIQHTMLSKTLIKKKFAPTNKFRRFFYELQASKYFEAFITI
jgi:voltage-gated cation channel